MTHSKSINVSAMQMQAIILSHGWFALKPFSANTNPPSLKISFDLPYGSGSFKLSSNKQNSSTLYVMKGSKKICEKVSNICLSDDVDPYILYRLNGKSKKWYWLQNNHLGKFLRSPSLYEDCCKAILSTNTTWQRTVTMVNKLVDSYGRKIGEMKAFPRPDKLLDISESNLRAKTGCGFRAKYLHHLADSTKSQCNIFLDDKWKALNNSEFYNTLNSIKGLGPASINYISLLYWKPNGYNIDAYVSRRCKELWGIDGKNIPSFLKKRYQLFGQYAPLVLWFEITKHWHQKRGDTMRYGEKLSGIS